MNGIKSKRESDKGEKRVVKQSKTYYWMVLPAFLIFFVFHTVPVFQGMIYSFTNYKGYGDFNFVGLKNYVNLFQDQRILASYGFTFKFAIVSTLLVNIISLAIAIGLNAKIKFQNTLRAVFFVPNILSVLIVGFIFNYLFAFFIPQIAEKLGITSLTQNILGNPDLAWVGIVIVAVWQAVAFNTILYLAGLQTIPTELYEAASLDGAGKWKSFKHITFPLIASFFTINMVLAMKNFLMVFDHIIAMTNGGPGQSTEAISVLIYKGGFSGGEFAYQAANSVVYFILIVVISILQIKFLRKREVDM